MSEEAHDIAAKDALRRLEQRLAQASDAAERLIVETADAVSGRSRSSGGREEPPSAAADRQRGQEPPPAAGYQQRTEERDRLSEDLELLAGLARRFRDLIPPELERRLSEALRELMLALRALIDWYLERLERRRRTPPEVRDIPIR